MACHRERQRQYARFTHHGEERGAWAGIPLRMTTCLFSRPTHLERACTTRYRRGFRAQRGCDPSHAEGVGDYYRPVPLLIPPDGTADQRELERLAANVRSVQREEAAARLPSAAQLPSVPGLAPVGDGFGRHIRWSRNTCHVVM